MVVCEVFTSYVSIAREFHRNADGSINWTNACLDADPQGEDICPSGFALQEICTLPLQTDLNPSVKIEYCEPLFGPFSNETDVFNDCVNGCVNYVSRARGDCCDFVCEGEV